MSGDTLTPTPYFKTTLPFTNPSIFMEKSEPPPFFKNSENSTRGRGVGGTIML